MGLDFIQKKNNQFVTCERRSFEEQLGGDSLFSATPHLVHRRFNCILNDDVSFQAVPGRLGIIILTAQGAAVIASEAPTEILGYITGGAEEEIRHLFESEPQVPNCLPVKIVDVNEIAPTFTVEIVNDEESHD
ncbi:hypothetical protein DDZ13_09660 [Coraliomargarita sinensis]|uniref:Uncharacterized protein n=1 Tax=Coraliomargarita sinensis TaxID=2174842 RepID=A0A317ZET7_9BACT|nr:hypothetical protein [Coraliomargarita sinensis]PXA03896.1 hypothetical protein DDZ13_09660 [Coraliomargarita sinensis]